MRLIPCWICALALAGCTGDNEPGNPSDAEAPNVTIPSDLTGPVEQARREGCDTVVYASTSSIYGDRTEPSSEDLPVEANTGYEASMLSRERYAEYYNEFHDDLAVAGTRFFSVYQGYGGAEAHKGGYANTVSQWAEKMARGERPVLWGDGERVDWRA